LTGILTGLLATGKKRTSLPGRDLLELAEADGSEPRSQRLGRDVDGRLGPAGRGKDDPTPLRRHPRELLEERDHVHEDDEVERSFIEWELVRVSDLEADAAGQLLRQQAVGLRDHLRREIDPRDVGLLELAGDETRGLTGSGAEIEHLARRFGQTLERRVERDQTLGADALLPDRREPVELGLEGSPKDPPEPRSRDDRAGSESREATAGRFEAFVQATGDSFTSCPTRVENMLAASPWLMASAMFRYASS
jgi:hypothetical protein